MRPAGHHHREVGAATLLVIVLLISSCTTTAESDARDACKEADDLTDEWEDDEYLDPDEQFMRRLDDLSPEDVALIAADGSAPSDASAAQRIAAARQLRWQDPARAASIILAMVNDVDLEGDDRLQAIQEAIRA